MISENKIIAEPLVQIRVRTQNGPPWYFSLEKAQELYEALGSAIQEYQLGRAAHSPLAVQCVV